MALYTSIDVAGQKFGKWTAIRPTGEKTKNGTNIWLCECECGNVGFVSINNLRSGSSKSCGCISKERMSRLNYKHGGKNERLYMVWSTMLRRCRDTKTKDFENYGGRGITVCDEWKDYSMFKAWALANGYDPNAKPQECTIDRIDGTKGYSPDNCRWVSAKVQQNNRRDNVLLTYNGETQMCAQWNRECGFSKNLVDSRIKRGWTVEEAITTPPRGMRHSPRKQTPA